MTLGLQRPAERGVMNPYVRGYRRAARHLLDLGLLPAPCRDEMRVLWANSPEDRQLVTYIAERWELTR